MRSLDCLFLEALNNPSPIILLWTKWLVYFALTRSERLILRAIAENPTQKELLSATALSPRTIRYATGRLKKLGLIDEFVSLNDTRRRFCRIRGDGRTVMHAPAERATGIQLPLPTPLE